MKPILIVIPARYESSRFPGKPLADICGKPMVQHVWERACRIKRADRILVATDDDRIAACVKEFGGEVIITAANHKTGTERVAEVAAGLPFPFVVNLQGDLPVFDPGAVDRVIEEGVHLIEKEGAALVTAKSEILSKEELASPHVVKVVATQAGRALYFSRSPIPYIETGNDTSFKSYKHYGIYLYQRDFLLKIAASKEGALESVERLEQLRVLEAGFSVHLVEIGAREASFFLEVNRPEDLREAREILRNATLS